MEKGFFNKECSSKKAASPATNLADQVGSLKEPNPYESLEARLKRLRGEHGIDSTTGPNLHNAARVVRSPSDYDGTFNSVWGEANLDNTSRIDMNGGGLESNTNAPSKVVNVATSSHPYTRDGPLTSDSGNVNFETNAGGPDVASKDMMVRMLLLLVLM